MYLTNQNTFELLDPERAKYAHNNLEKLQETIAGSPIDAKVTGISSNAWGKYIFVCFDKKLDAGEKAILKQIIVGSEPRPKQAPKTYVSPFTGKIVK